MTRTSPTRSRFQTAADVLSGDTADVYFERARRIFPQQASVVADLTRRNGAASHWSGMTITRPSNPIIHASLDSRRL